ncbi:MAG: nickel-dependent hydrogenase large subunit [Planctomycetes bacterium]|nr:nickel-dependent hydrogenase large subunit [Planctomycetota bacterium]
MTHKTLIPIGPYHPLQEEAEFFQLFVEGETVVDMDVRISYNHRGIEGVVMNRTWDQVPYVVERVCGICSASHPLAYVQAVEEIAEVEVPERALYIRTIINELERIHSHLLWFGLAGHFIGYNTVFMWAWRYRDPCLDALEIATGSRINYANHTVGGSRLDLDPGKVKVIHEKLDEIEKPLDMFISVALGDPILSLRLKDVGVLSEEAARTLGACGPTVRASNVPIDVRRDDPYAAYDRLDWDVITCENGDVFDKVVVRLLEIKEAIRILRQALRDLPEGPIQTKVEEIPPGEGVGHVEAPRGETFHFVKSNGGPGPERLKIRAPTYNNLPTFKASCIGQAIADVTITLASIDPCYSCTERMLVVRDADSGKELMDFADLVRLSRQKTEDIRSQL